MATSRTHLLSLSRSKVDWMITRYPPWAKILTRAMKEMYVDEMKNVHWRKVRRSMRSLSLLFGKGSSSKVFSSPEIVAMKKKIVEMDETEKDDTEKKENEKDDTRSNKEENVLQDEKKEMGEKNNVVGEASKYAVASSVVVKEDKVE